MVSVMSAGDDDSESATMAAATTATVTDSTLPDTSTPLLASSEGPGLDPNENLLFLQTTAAQTIAGAFVWAALLITCHQVGPVSTYPYGNSDGMYSQTRYTFVDRN